MPAAEETAQQGSETTIRVLLIEDNPDDADLIQIMLKRKTSTRFVVTVRERLADALALLEESEQSIDVVLLDLTLPDAAGIGTFLKLHAKFPDLPVAVLTGLNDERLADEAVRQGAQDYLVKGHVDGPLLANCIRYAIERKKADIERRQLTKRIQESQHLESLGVLAGGVAHDFNNLLMGILGNVQLMLMELPEESAHRACLEQIKELIAHSTELTSQLLVYSGRSIFLQNTLELNRTIGQLRAELVPSIAKSTAVRLDLSQEPLYVQADAGQLRQMLRNLITNAQEAIDQAGRPGVITVRSRCLLPDREFLQRAKVGVYFEQRPYVCIEVEDNGCGIGEEMKEKVLDPFFSTKFLGRGLGLAAVAGIVRRHKGAIRIDSDLDSGTVVRILLPKAQENGVPSQNRDAIKMNEPGSKGKILLVDDEEAVRTVGSKILQRHGYLVVAVPDGEAAVAAFTEARGEVDVVLLDLTMPGLSPQAVCRSLHELDPDVKILLTSGYSENYAISATPPPGVVGFIQKPWDVDCFIAKLDEII